MNVSIDELEAIIQITAITTQEGLSVPGGAARTALTDGRVVKLTQRLGSSRTN